MNEWKPLWCDGGGGEDLKPWLQGDWEGSDKRGLDGLMNCRARMNGELGPSGPQES